MKGWILLVNQIATFYAVVDKPEIIKELACVEWDANPYCNNSRQQAPRIKTKPAIQRKKIL